MKCPEFSPFANNWFNDAGFWLLMMSLLSFCDVIVFNIILRFINGR